MLLLDNVNVHEKLEAFALTLKFYLAQNKQKSLSKIEEMLIYYVDYAVRNILKSVYNTSTINTVSGNQFRK